MVNHFLEKNILDQEQFGLGSGKYAKARKGTAAKHKSNVFSPLKLKQLNTKAVQMEFIKNEKPND